MSIAAYMHNEGADRAFFCFLALAGDLQEQSLPIYKITITEEDERQKDCVDVTVEELHLV